MVFDVLSSFCSKQHADTSRASDAVMGALGEPLAEKLTALVSADQTRWGQHSPRMATVVVGTLMNMSQRATAARVLAVRVPAACGPCEAHFPY
jgi:hypothetical protein